MTPPREHALQAAALAWHQARVPEPDGGEALRHHVARLADQLGESAESVLADLAYAAQARTTHKARQVFTSLVLGE